jgi:hypothetical protein
MQRIIIFRFHKFPLICANRLKLLKKLNPNVLIFGIYGGELGNLPKFERYLNKYLENIFIIKNKSSSWKWENIDLTLRDWYKQIGKNISFDMAHIIEWDLILCKSLDDIYSGIAKNELGLTALIDLKLVENKWSWTSKEPYKSEWLKLIEFVKRKYNYSDKPNGSLGPGPCLPKKFIEKYANAEVPELCNDELRVPLFAQVFKFKCIDTDFYRKWFDDEEKKYFNCVGRDIDIQTIRKERENNGRQVFHPFRRIFNEL